MASGQGPEQYIQAQQETHVQLKKTDQNTRRGRRQQGVAQLEPDLPGTGHRQPVAVGGRGRPGRAPCFCQQMLEPLAGAEVPTDGTLHRGGSIHQDREQGTVGREGQHWHRPISISFQQTQKTLTKEREASWLHTREVSLWQGQISAHKFRHKLCPLPATNPNLSHPGTRALPLTQQLSGCLWPMPTGSKRQSCPSSRATVPALIPPAL